MKKRLDVRMSERRLNKLRLYAAYKDKTMTAVLEELIDSLSTKGLSAIPLNTDLKNSV